MSDSMYEQVLRRDFQRKELEKAESGPAHLRQVFVGGVSRYAEERDLLSVFETAGTVVALRWGVDRRSGHFKGFVHVEFATEADAIAAVDLGGTSIRGQAVRVSRARGQQGKSSRGTASSSGGDSGFSHAPNRTVSRLTCLRCRQRGHKMADCPLLASRGRADKKGRGRRGSQVSCYNCGGNSHRASQCRRGKIGNGFTFAVCFICNEKGHLSSQCAKNDKGLYPNGGGCRICGDNKHLAKNCPEKTRKSGKRKHFDSASAAHGAKSGGTNELSGNYAVDSSYNAYDHVLHDEPENASDGDSSTRRRKHKKQRRGGSRY